MLTEIFRVFSQSLQANGGVLYWTQNICEHEQRQNKSGGGDGKGKGRSKTHHVLSLPLSPRISSGCSRTCVFATVNAARRYLATSIPSNKPCPLLANLYLLEIHYHLLISFDAM
jgi:hypothetical protein